MVAGKETRKEMRERQRAESVIQAVTNCEEEDSRAYQDPFHQSKDVNWLDISISTQIFYPDRNPSKPMKYEYEMQIVS